MVRRRPQVPQDDGVYWYIFDIFPIFSPFLPIFSHKTQFNQNQPFFSLNDFNWKDFEDSLRLMMGMIGFTVGFIGFLLHNVVDCIEEPILERSLGYGWQPFGFFVTSIVVHGALSCSTLIDWVRLRRKHCISMVMANWNWNYFSWCIISYNCLFSPFGRWIRYPRTDSILKWNFNSTYL